MLKGMRLKVAMVSVIGPKNNSPGFPQDLELHAFSRLLLERNNKDVHFEWLLGSHKDWRIPVATGPRTTHIEFDSSMLEELRFEHPSLDHGSMINALLSHVGNDFDFVVVLDPDCFLTGEGNLLSLLSTMKRELISVAGTPYGMQFPKNFYRDFPAAFFMVFSTELIRLSELDFRIDHQFDASFRGEMRPAQMQGLTWVSKVRYFFMSQISHVLKFIFGIHNPTLWWGFLSEFKASAGFLEVGGDTGAKVRSTLMNNHKHLELRVVQRPDFSTSKAAGLAVFRKKSEINFFPNSAFFRNHGMFEGSKPSTLDPRSLILWLIVLAYLRRMPEIEPRFPPHSIAQVDQIYNSDELRRLMKRFPEIDLWSFKNTLFAVHLGYRTKNLLAESGDWDSFMAMLSTINDGKPD
jgi:hypothetical protein